MIDNGAPKQDVSIGEPSLGGRHEPGAMPRVLGCEYPQVRVYGELWHVSIVLQVPPKDGPRL